MKPCTFTQLLLTSNYLTSNSETNEENRPSLTQSTDLISKLNRQLLLDKCSSCWLKLWDLALNGDPKCVSAMQVFIRIISYHSHSNSAYPICDANSLDSSLFAHSFIYSTVMNAAYCVSDILDSLQAPASI